MFQFLKDLFGRKSKKINKGTSAKPNVRIGVEELMPRVLPSANPFFMAWGHYSGGDTHQAFTPAANFGGTQSSVSELFGGGECGHGQGGSHGTAFTASLSDAAGASGQAQYNPATGILTIQVKGAADSSSLSVSIDGGTSVGTVQTGTSGYGRVSITLPSGTTIQGASTISVGDLTGTFTQIEFSATLTGATGVSGSANYNSDSNKLGLHISGAAADTTYNVTLDGTQVGQLTTNSSGAGRLKITLASGVTLKAGSVLAISDTTGDAPILTGTFA